MFLVLTRYLVANSRRWQLSGNTLDPVADLMPERQAYTLICQVRQHSVLLLTAMHLASDFYEDMVLLISDNAIKCASEVCEPTTKP